MRTQAALTAQKIRTELKEKFPKIKFNIHSKSYAGGNSVRISYTDGVNQKEVEAIVNKYQEGHFDGMFDIYEYSNSRNDIPQVKFVFVDREYSEEMKSKIIEKINNRYGISVNESEYYERFMCYGHTLIYREFQTL